MYFNVFEAAPENDRDGPSQQAAQNVGGKVCKPEWEHSNGSLIPCLLFRSCRSISYRYSLCAMCCSNNLTCNQRFVVG